MKVYYTLVVLSLLIEIGCSSDVDSGNGNEEYPYGPTFTVEDSGSEHAIYDFAYRFMDASAEVWAEEGMSNNVMSPLGACVTLAMLANGSSPEAKSEILNTLAIEESQLSAYNATMNKICRDFPHDVKGSTIALANGFWIYDDWNINSQYEDVLTNQYLAEVNKLGNSSELNVANINDWVSKQTKGMIPELFNSPIIVKMLVANALYLNAKWDKKFNEIKIQKFNNYDGNRPEVEMMSGTQEIESYYESTDGDQLFSLTYSDRHLSMFVFLPSVTNPETIHDYERLKTSYYAQQGITPDCGRAHITMPKFKIDIKNDLIHVFKSMGVNALFGSNSIEGVSTEDDVHPGINLFFQKLRMDVDEEGTTAAAVTVAGMETSNLPTAYVPEEIIIDRPFLFLIYAYGLPVIAGQVVNFD